MEQYFRIAIWMFVVTGYLQSSPLPIGIGSLRLDVLLRDVECDNVNFTSPTFMPNCTSAHLEIITKGLNEMETQCRKKKNTPHTLRIRMTLKGLKEIERFDLTNSSDCTLLSEGPRKQLEAFVNDTKEFVRRLNDQYGTTNRP